MKVAAYVRVSTNKQDETIQRNAIEEWCATRKSQIESVAWFIDHGRSGATMDRPALANLQRAIFRREVDTVVMYALDRFARAMVDGLSEIQRWEEERIRIVFIKDSITLDPDNPIGRLCMKIMTAITLAMAEAEREKIRQRSRDGYQALLDKQRKVKNMAATGMAPAQIARRTGIPIDRVKRMIAAPKDRAYWATMQKRKPKAEHARAWELVQKGLSHTEAAKVLGIHHDTIRLYLKAERKRRAKLCETQPNESSESSARNAGKS